MKRYLTITVVLGSLLATPALSMAQSQEPCEPKQDSLAQIVDQVMQELATEKQTLRNEAIESGHLYILDVMGKEVCVVLRDPQDRRAPFAIQLPKEWKPVLDGTKQASAASILGAVREGFDDLVTQVKAKHQSGEQIGQDTAHFQHLGYQVTAQYLDELQGRLLGSGAKPDVKLAGLRLKAAADARLAGQPNPYTSDDAEAKDIKKLYGYLKSVNMVYFTEE